MISQPNRSFLGFLNLNQYCHRPPRGTDMFRLTHWCNETRGFTFFVGGEVSSNISSGLLVQVEELFVAFGGVSLSTGKICKFRLQSKE